MQSVSSRIWTRVAVSISYDDNHYTMGTSIHYTTGRLFYSFLLLLLTLPDFFTPLYKWFNFLVAFIEVLKNDLE